MDFSNIDQSVPRSLPLLDTWVGEYRGPEVLKGVTVLFIQHQLGNHFPQAKALLDLGLDRTRLIWIDVPYTATPEVRQVLIAELGIPAANFHIHDFRVLENYPPYQIRRVQQILAQMLAEPPERLVVLDDGAYFLEAAACFAKQLPAVAIVEQTTRGLIKIEESAALQCYSSRVPIVNVARSTPKRTLEPPFIGRAVCESLRKHLAQLPANSGSLRCLVLGYGAIGRQIAEFLPQAIGIARSRVHVHDSDAARQNAAVGAHFSRWCRGDFKQRFHVVIGCSGRQSFTLGDRAYLEDGALLASASSGTVELSRQDFVELAAASDFDDISVCREGLDEQDVHSNLHMKLVDRTATFLNGGFPINFDGRVNCIPARYIQPTPTMMVAATIQAVKAIDDRQCGIVELDPTFCTWVDEAFRKELGDESSLLPAAQ